ncbi:MAG: hypothetical protein WCE63_12795 [Acidobacteriaceae bacterium]
MAYILRFIQQYKPADRQAFLNIEAKFKDMSAGAKLGRNAPLTRRTVA